MCRLYLSLCSSVNATLDLPQTARLYTTFAKLPIVAFDVRQREFAFDDFTVEVKFKAVVRLMQYFIRAGVGYSDTAAAFIDGAFIGEEFQGVVEDFYGIGGGLDKLLRGLVEAVGLEEVADLKHKIPVDV